MFTEADWYCPGGAWVNQIKQIHLIPPPHWHRLILEIKRVPPSMNTNEIRSHWTGFQKHKKEWQGEIEQLLMVEKVKRDGYFRAIAGAWMRFPKRVARRDSGNFASVLTKACGDALARDSSGNGYGAIPDDDERRYYFGGVEFEEETGPALTQLVIYLQPKEG